MPSRSTAAFAEPEPRFESVGDETFYERKRGVIEAFEREYFRGLAARCSGNVSAMARQSGMKRHHVRAYLRRYGIDARNFSPMCPALSTVVA